jgi:hypothetical protein
MMARILILLFQNSVTVSGLSRFGKHQIHYIESSEHPGYFYKLILKKSVAHGGTVISKKSQHPIQYLNKNNVISH